MASTRTSGQTAGFPKPHSNPQDVRSRVRPVPMLVAEQLYLPEQHSAPTVGYSPPTCDSQEPRPESGHQKFAAD